ncbi:hypothetical protein Dimus_020928 [Dionaea muscipula]
MGESDTQPSIEDLEKKKKKEEKRSFVPIFKVGETAIAQSMDIVIGFVKIYFGKMVTHEEGVVLAKAKELKKQKAAQKAEAAKHQVQQTSNVPKKSERKNQKRDARRREC